MTTFTVPAKGIGRKDYSRNVDFAVQPTLRGHQGRQNWYAEWTLPTVPFGYIYVAYLRFFDAEGNLVYPAPDIPYHLYRMVVTTERNALILVALYRFASWADMMVFNYDKWYGDLFGYGEAELRFTNGIKTEEGKLYAVAFSEYSEEATFTAHFLVNSLREEIIYG